MIQFDMLLQRYPGYTVRTLMDEDSDVVRLMLDICNACAEEAKKTRG